MSNPLLITKYGALGDLLVSTAAIEELCKLSEFKKISLLGPDMFLQLLDPTCWKNLSSIWVLHNSLKYAEEYLPQQNQWAPTQQKQNIFSLFKLHSASANLRYESSRFAWPALFAHHKVRIGSLPWWSGYQYTHRAPWLGLEPLIHERDRNLQVISQYPGLENKQSEWQGKTLPILRNTDGNCVKKYNLDKKNYLLLNPTASKKFKAWPAQNYKTLFSELKNKFSDLQIKIIGTSNESAWLQEVNPDPSTWLQPKNLIDLIDIVSHAKFLVSNASSMHFIACSYQVPCLVLMGASLPEMWAPLGPKSSFIRGKYSISKHPEQNEIEGFRSIAVETVLDKICRQLENLD